MNRFNVSTQQKGLDRDDRLAQQKFDNRFKKATGISEADKMRYGNEMQRRSDILNAIGGGTQMLGQMGSTAASIWSASDICRYLNVSLTIE